MIPSYPKVFTIGDPTISRMFASPVEVTEKIDGSMFAFCRDAEGELHCRSKGAIILPDAPPKMFAPAVAWVKQAELRPGWMYYGEAVCRPKHNVLCYDRTPPGFVMLFGIRTADGWVEGHDLLAVECHRLGLAPVPYLGTLIPGTIEASTKALLETPSILGGTLVEGIVVKNYTERVLVGGHVWPCFGKYVREEFKERLHKEFKTGRDKLQDFLNSFCTEARWRKAVQHLQEKGQLEHSPRDIGLLVKEIAVDLAEEERRYIEESMFKLFIAEIQRRAKHGFPEWYKTQLLEAVFHKSLPGSDTSVTVSAQKRDSELPI